MINKLFINQYETLEFFLQYAVEETNFENLTEKMKNLKKLNKWKTVATTIQ
jgi:hypothetical protein